MKGIHFKKIQWKKPDLKGKWQKLKNMKPGDIKAHLKKQHERRQQILEKRRNSKFAKKMAPYYKIMNRFSLPLQALWACIINFIIDCSLAVYDRNTAGIFVQCRNDFRYTFNRLSGAAPGVYTTDHQCIVALSGCCQRSDAGKACYAV